MRFLYLEPNLKIPCICYLKNSEIFIFQIVFENEEIVKIPKLYVKQIFAHKNKIVQ